MKLTSPANPPLVFRLLRGCWRAIDALRRTTLNLIFLLVLAVVLVAVFSTTPTAVDDKSVLVLNFNGPIVEQQSGNGSSLLFQQLENRPHQILLRDVVAALDQAAHDDRIISTLLVLDDLRGAGFASLHEIAAALDRFKASGKKVVAWGSSFDQRQYYLAAQAHEVYMHPMGMVLIEGFGGYRNYYRDAMDKLGLTVHAFRVGEYKNFAEPYVANGPSDATRESDKLLYDALWSTYTGDIEKARKLAAGTIAADIEQLPQRFAQANHNAAKLALQSKLIDGIKTRDELRQMLIERGVMDEESKTFRQVPFANYLAAIKPLPVTANRDVVGVIVAEGEISDGIAPAGQIGGRSTADLVRKAREDKYIKAVVLRVNSPGGSSFGSELIRRELELTRKAGKPVIVSMGNVAASGGYWISMAADEIIADPATITGSIGVFALLPGGEKAMDKLSLHTDGYTTTWLAGAYDPRRPLDPRFGQLIQGSIEHIYNEFITHAATARRTTPEKINAVAQGRVWTGAQAKERDLIDRLGTFQDAIKAAKAKAGLTEASRIVYIEPEPTRLERWLERLGADILVGLDRHLDLSLTAWVSAHFFATDVRRDWEWLSRMRESTQHNPALMTMAHCLCAPNN